MINSTAITYRQKNLAGVILYFDITRALNHLPQHYFFMQTMPIFKKRTSAFVMELFHLPFNYLLFGIPNFFLHIPPSVLNKTRIAFEPGLSPSQAMPCCLHPSCPRRMVGIASMCQCHTDLQNVEIFLVHRPLALGLVPSTD